MFNKSNKGRSKPDKKLRIFSKTKNKKIMKKKIIVIVTFVISVFFLNTDSFSQDKKYFVSLLGGVSLPLSNFSNGYVPGLNLEGRAGVITSENVGLGADVSYSMFSRKNKYGIYSGGEHYILSLKGIVLFKRFNSLSTIIPYASIAAGVNIKSNANAKTIWGDINSEGFYTSFAIDLGGGVSFKASKDLEIDLESKLNSAFDNPLRIFSVNFKAGVNYNF